ncbi:MAG: hypothetical protein ABIP65_09600, partial [Vicinamibacterales bacterium]
EGDRETRWDVLKAVPSASRPTLSSRYSPHGMCNDILTRMESTGVPFADAVRDAAAALDRARGVVSA